jgi:hypothetical protein
MNSRRNIAAIVLALATVSTAVQAQERIQFAEYSAKFLCGVVKEEGAASVRPGFYDTSINIHNPQIVSSTTFFKKVVFAPREGEDPVRPSRFRRDELKADFAEHVDCKIIRSMLAQPQSGASFVEGFVVLIAVAAKGIPTDLDVVGVYTVSNPQGQDTDLEILPAKEHVLTFPLATGTKLRDQMLEDSKSNPDK